MINQIPPHKMPSDLPKSSLLLKRIKEAPASAACKQSYCHPTIAQVPDHVVGFHNHNARANQCCYSVTRHISAPVSAVWSVVRRFDNPQAYKHFIKSCHVILGDGGVVGALRQILVISGLPAASSVERLEILDDEQHVISFSIVGGKHRLVNYRSVTTLNETDDGCGTVVVESYVVDVPEGRSVSELV